MPLASGTSLGPYQIESPLGAGGEVSQARDTKLDRDVALKVLPQAFTDDPDGVRSWKWPPSLLRASLILALTLVSSTVAHSSELLVSYGVLERHISMQSCRQRSRTILIASPALSEKPKSSASLNHPADPPTLSLRPSHVRRSHRDDAVMASLKRSS